jgi:hypothetical protein
MNIDRASPSQFRIPRVTWFLIQSYGTLVSRRKDGYIVCYHYVHVLLLRFLLLNEEN